MQTSMPTTAAPSSSRRRTVASPIPDAAPVTSRAGRAATVVGVVADRSCRALEIAAQADVDVVALDDLPTLDALRAANPDVEVAQRILRPE